MWSAVDWFGFSKSYEAFVVCWLMHVSTCNVVISLAVPETVLSGEQGSELEGQVTLKTGRFNGDSLGALGWKLINLR